MTLTTDRTVKLIECPRDAMQGIKQFIPTEKKAAYINSLLSVGFDTIDFGSFVSPKAIPQMRDTAEVLSLLNLQNTDTKLLAIVANTKGALQASMFEEIDYLGFPFSISEIFQMRNTHKTIDESIVVLDEILQIASRSNKKVVTYVSMGFGNPYGDPWDVELVMDWVERLVQMGVEILSLSDTIGGASADSIEYLYKHLIPTYSKIEFGAHFHTHYDAWHEKIDAAYVSGCRRFDGAIKGFVGCPMAKDELIGNMPTEKLLSYFTAKQVATGIQPMSFESAYNACIQTLR